jgi:glycosyltransferase involved in cell wall biosynthesis
LRYPPHPFIYILLPDQFAPSTSPFGAIEMSIAVIITCFNEGAYIQQAVNSVLEQTIGDQIDEIIIIDDGSSPPTLDVLRSLPRIDPRIELILECGNGLASNRNIAISRTSSEYIAVLDGDDFWVHDKLARQMTLLQSDEQVALVYSALILFRDDEPSKRAVVSVRDLRYSGDPLLEYFIYDAPIVPSSVLMRRAAFDYVGGFNETIPVFEDTEFYLRLLRSYQLAAISDPLVYKRAHSSAITAKRHFLMKHHANVAFHFAAQESRLLPYIARRLGERARKLGNLEAKDGYIDEAMDFYRLALSLDPLNLPARVSKLVLKCAGQHGINVLASQWGIWKYGGRDT